MLLRGYKEITLFVTNNHATAYQVLQGVLTSDEVAKRKEVRLSELQLAFSATNLTNPISPFGAPVAATILPRTITSRLEISSTRSRAVRVPLIAIVSAVSRMIEFDVRLPGKTPTLVASVSPNRKFTPVRYSMSSGALKNR